ncbi:MAG: hypothetical protein EOP04_31310, partial [Proteobacteria bacterium]
MKFVAIILAMSLTACSGYDSQRPTLRSNPEKYQGGKTGDAQGETGNETGNETGTTTNPPATDGTATDPVVVPPV